MYNYVYVCDKECDNTAQSHELIQIVGDTMTMYTASKFRGHDCKCVNHFQWQHTSILLMMKHMLFVTLTFTALPPICSVLMPKSTPTVGMPVDVNMPSIYLLMMLALPTPESPINTILNR